MSSMFTDFTNFTNGISLTGIRDIAIINSTLEIITKLTTNNRVGDIITVSKVPILVFMTVCSFHLIWSSLFSSDPSDPSDSTNLDISNERFRPMAEGLMKKMDSFKKEVESFRRITDGLDRDIKILFNAIGTLEESLENSNDYHEGEINKVNSSVNKAKSRVERVNSNLKNFILSEYYPFRGDVNQQLDLLTGAIFVPDDDNSEDSSYQADE